MNAGNGLSPDIEVRPHLPCPRCDGELLFSVRHPVQEAWGGIPVRGCRTATLCPHCHKDAPEAQGLLAFFAVHERITEHTLRDVTGVLQEWLDYVTANPPTYTDEELDEDIRSWESGDL